MKTITNNSHNLKESDITHISEKVKALIINSKNEILLAHSGNRYHFPGGKKEKYESINETLIREVREETGIDISKMKLNYFAQFIGYFKDYPKEGENNKTIIYYFEVLTDQLPINEEMSLTDNEMSKNFKIISIELPNLKELLVNNAIKYGDEKGIAREMIELLNIYL